MPTQVVVWSQKYWIIGAILAIAVGVAQVLTAAAKGDAMPFIKVLSRLWSSIIGGVVMILVGRSLNLDPNMIMLLAALGGGMGIQLLDVGKSILAQKFGIELERRK